jgi:uncharacterized protein (DUF1778 family)
MSDYAAMAAEIDALSEEELRLSEGTIVQSKIPRARREDVMSIRVRPDELSEIMRAAASRGQRVSDFVRDAVLLAARGQAPDQRLLPAPVADALDELVERIEEQRRLTGHPRRARR